MTQNLHQEIFELIVRNSQFALGFLSALIVEPVRKWLFRPKLKMEFKSNQDFKTFTPEGYNRAYYVRVCVKNDSWYTAYNCRAYLTKIEVKNEFGKFIETGFVDPLRLAWAAQPTDDAYRPIDIPNGICQFFDVLSTRPMFKRDFQGLTFDEMIKSSEFESRFKLETHVSLLRHKYLEKSPGEYRYSVLVSADGTKPQSMKLIFKWDNKWDKFEVRRD